SGGVVSEKQWRDRCRERQGYRLDAHDGDDAERDGADPHQHPRAGGGKGGLTSNSALIAPPRSVTSTSPALVRASTLANRVAIVPPSAPNATPNTITAIAASSSGITPVSPRMASTTVAAPPIPSMSVPLPSRRVVLLASRVSAERRRPSPLHDRAPHQRRAAEEPLDAPVGSLISSYGRSR